MSKKQDIKRPTRDPDHYSKRDVPYWFSPDWVRGTSADDTADEVHFSVRGEWSLNNAGKWIRPCISYGKIAAVKDGKGDVDLYMKSKDGNMSFIKGSIQREFKAWHTDRSIDYILLGMDLDELIKDEN